MYGTLKMAWQGVLRESEQQHDIHLEVKDRLLEQVTSHIKSWQKENYSKMTLPRGYHTKQAKEADDNFRRVGITIEEEFGGNCQYWMPSKSAANTVTQDVRRFY